MPVLHLSINQSVMVKEGQNPSLHEFPTKHRYPLQWNYSRAFNGPLSAARQPPWCNYTHKKHIGAHSITTEFNNKSPNAINIKDGSINFLPLHPFCESCCYFVRFFFLLDYKSCVQLTQCWTEDPFCSPGHKTWAKPTLKSTSQGRFIWQLKGPSHL